jgi:hypothetical protein
MATFEVVVPTFDDVQAYRLTLESDNVLEDEPFAEAVRRGIEVLNLDEGTVARAFDANRLTIERWRHGRNLVHPALRPAIVRWFQKQASRVADELAVAEGRATVEEIERKNAFITADRTIVHWDKAKHL